MSDGHGAVGDARKRLQEPRSGGRITVPRPQILTGPKHQTVDEATVSYLREAAKRVRSRQIWGSGVSALVADLCDSAADAIEDDS